MPQSLDLTSFSARDSIYLHKVQCSLKFDSFHLQSFACILPVSGELDNTTDWRIGGFFHYGSLITEMTTVVSLLTLPCGRNLLSGSPALHIVGTRNGRTHINTGNLWASSGSDHQQDQARHYEWFRKQSKPLWNSTGTSRPKKWALKGPQLINHLTESC